MQRNSMAFLDRTPKQRGHSMSEALALEAPTAMLFEATFAQPSRETGNKALLKFAVDPHGIAFDKPADQLQHASVDCVVRVYSMKGDIVKTGSSTMNAKLTPATFNKVMQSSVPCELSMELASGGYLLRLGVMQPHRPAGHGQRQNYGVLRG